MNDVLVLKAALLTVSFVIVVVLIGTLATMVVWAWVVPDIFAGAVESGLVLGTLSFIQAFKLNILALTLSLSFYGNSSSK